VPAGALSSSDSDGESTQHVMLTESEGTTAAAAGSMVAEELEEAAADAVAAALAAGEGGGPPEEAAGGAAEGLRGGLLASKEVQEMLAFAVPALGMVLADPLMSLIDTACVGRVSSLQLAALGPNTALFNFAHNLFAFLGVATTNIIASNSLKAAGLDAKTLKHRRAAAERTLCNSLTLATACGLVVGTVLLTCGRTLLAGMGTAPELMQPAWEYLSFRALAAPAVLIMSVSQGACLGQQDAWTPFSVLAAAGLLNAGALCCAACCAVLCCAVLCCAVLCRAVLWYLRSVLQAQCNLVWRPQNGQCACWLAQLLRRDSVPSPRCCQRFLAFLQRGTFTSSLK
jgi:hypothetical protein